MRLLKISLFLLILLPASFAAQQTSAADSYSRAQTLSEEGKYKEAVDAYEVALRSISDSSKQRDMKADILLGIGISQYHLNELEEAEKSLKRALSVRKSSHADTLYSLGLVELGNENQSAAQGYFTQAISADGNHGDAWFQLGEILLAQGNRERAKIAYRMAIKNETAQSERAISNLASLNSSSNEEAGN